MPEWAEIKIGQRGLLIASYKGLKKVSDRAVTPAAEAVQSVSLHTGAARVPTSQAAVLPSPHLHWGRAATGEKGLVSMHTGSFW